jgi:hypothetical protein
LLSIRNKTQNTGIMEIEIGKKYTLRNGLKTEEVEAANNGTNYIFKAKVKVPESDKPYVFHWKENGRYLRNETDHELDIVIN